MLTDPGNKIILIGKVLDPEEWSFFLAFESGERSGEVVGGGCECKDFEFSQMFRRKVRKKLILRKKSKSS